MDRRLERVIRYCNHEIRKVDETVPANNEERELLRQRKNILLYILALVENK